MNSMDGCVPGGGFQSTKSPGERDFRGLSPLSVRAAVWFVLIVVGFLAIRLVDRLATAPVGDVRPMMEVQEHELEAGSPNFISAPHP